jgi:GTP cyclohydrolase I
MLSQYSIGQNEYQGAVGELDRLDLEKAASAAFDLEGARSAIADFLVALGRDLSDPHLAETPRRVALAFEEMLTARPATWTTFPNSEGYTDLVLVKNIPFHSLCQHHLLPFRGVAHIGYLPGSRLIGLSKLARGLELFARDLQVQERLTVQTVQWLMETLDARGGGSRSGSGAPVHVAARCPGGRNDDDHGGLPGRVGCARTPVGTLFQ